MSKIDVKTCMTGALAGTAGTAGVYLAIVLLPPMAFLLGSSGFLTVW